MTNIHVAMIRDDLDGEVSDNINVDGEVSDNITGDDKLSDHVNVSRWNIYRAWLGNYFCSKPHGTNYLLDMSCLVNYICLEMSILTDTLNKNRRIHMMLDYVSLVEVNQASISLVKVFEGLLRLVSMN